jgi:hypothetical protein
MHLLGRFAFGLDHPTQALLDIQEIVGATGLAKVHLTDSDARVIHQIHTGAIAHQPAGRGELTVNDRTGTLLRRQRLTHHTPPPGSQ